MFRLVAWKNPHYARVYIILQTAGHYALFPLLYESPGKCLQIRLYNYVLLIQYYISIKVSEFFKAIFINIAI